MLVNNAGIAGPTAPVDAYDREQWDAVSAVNLSGTFDVKCAHSTKCRR